MFMHTLRRRMSALGAVLALSIALPFTGATPAHAQPLLSVTKTHVGDFVRGGQGTYHFTFTNTGDATTGTVRATDQYPQGLTFAAISNVDVTNGVTIDCPGILDAPTVLVCDMTFPANSSIQFDITLDVAPDAPCGIVTNTVTISEPDEGILTSASDPTRITGDTCPNGNGNGNGNGGDSILPVNLTGVVTLFNNISTNNNLHSPGATNTTHQNLGINAP